MQNQIFIWIPNAENFVCAQYAPLSKPSHWRSSHSSIGYPNDIRKRAFIIYKSIELLVNIMNSGIISMQQDFLMLQYLFYTFYFLIPLKMFQVQRKTLEKFIYNLSLILNIRLIELSLNTALKYNNTILIMYKKKLQLTVNRVCSGGGDNFT